MPAPVPTLQNVAIARVAAGASTSLAVDRDEGKLYCWGNNARGLCGLGDREEENNRLKNAFKVRKFDFVPFVFYAMLVFRL